MLKSKVSELQSCFERQNLLHDGNAGFVELVDHPLGRDTDSANEQSRLVPDDHFREFR